jgi:hypothetical protein
MMAETTPRAGSAVMKDPFEHSVLVFGLPHVHFIEVLPAPVAGAARDGTLP